MNVLLVDGYNMLHRSRSGWNKGDNPIIYTFFRSFRSVVEKFRPDTVYFVLEGRPVKRLEMMEQYKAQRVYHDKDDFQRQKKIIINTLKTQFPVHVVRHPHYECDDLLANLATVKHVSDECVVVSSDSDFYQLLQTHSKLKIYNPIRKKFIEVPEYDYVTWKALKGDASDNIPGFKGIGNKTASKIALNPDLLREFLECEKRNEKFMLNCEMIRFHDMTEELDTIEASKCEASWPDVRSEFSKMKFFSITNDNFWPKFVDTFSTLA
jgi:5'-3' exonuclease